MERLETTTLIDQVRRLGPARENLWRDSAEASQAFGWEIGTRESRNLELADTLINASRGYIGPEPALLFASSIQRGDVSPRHSAALFGYHSAVPWGMLIDEDGLRPFSPQWQRGDDWYFLDLIAWDRLEEQADILSAFQPAAVRNNEPAKIFIESGPPPKPLRSIDDELVRRLDARREEAMSYTAKPADVDRQLQSLFAKLFVLRIIEDRQLEQRVPRLSQALLTSDSLEYESLVDIFSKAQTYICSDLFAEIDLSAIPEGTIAHVIDDLYNARNLPGGGQRYNFSWIDSDILGHAYEKYLSTILNPLGQPAQSELFNEKNFDVGRYSVRKSYGVYYTPEFLTKFAAKKCVDQFYIESDHSLIPKIIDFACGSGSFLVAAFDALLAHLKAIDPTRNWAREIVEGEHLYGVDVDESAVTLARLNLWNRMTEEPDPLPLPRLSKTIITGNGLDQETWTGFPKSFDVALGNPPFLTTSRIGDREAIEERFATAKGRYDYSYLFLEQAIGVTEPSGAIGMVVPNRLYINRNASLIRELVTERLNLLAIVDFGSTEVFAGIGAYVGCIIGSHRPVLSEPADKVTVIEVSEMPENFAAAFLLQAGADPNVAGERINVFEAQHPRGRDPWILLSPRERLSQMSLSEVSTDLGEICDIFQGIRTGANDIFIVAPLTDIDESVIEVKNGLGDVASIERRMLRPVSFGSSISKYDVLAAEKLIVYPYMRDASLSLGEIEALFPLGYKYLHRYRDFLAGRASIQGSGLQWFDLVRRRDEAWLSAPKLAIRDLAPETSFAVDLEGGIFLVGGTAVVPPREELLLPFLAYLNSNHVNELLKRVTPHFRGDFQKFEPQHLVKVPVLNRLTEDESFSAELEALALKAIQAVNLDARKTAEREIDFLVGEVLKAAGIL